MRILLINPRNIEEEYDSTIPPMGVCMISAVLKRDGYFVKGLNLDYNPENLSLKENIERHLIDYDINFVGISSLSNAYNQVSEILSIIKSFNSSIVTLLGGGILNYSTKEVFDSLENLDFGIIGEGERSSIELLDALKNDRPLSDVNGIIYSNNKETIITFPVELIKDLDSLPYPDFDEFNVEAFLDLQTPSHDYKLYPYDNPRMLTLFMSRSCPYGCTFCSHTIGRKYRSNSLDYFFEMLDYMIDKYKINMLQVLDELFSVNKERLSDFCKRIKPYNLKWWAQTRVNDISQETVNMMKDSGCFFISYGIEHINQDILKSMKKKIKVEDIERTLKLTYDAKLGIQGNVLIGDIAETEESFLEVFNWLTIHQKYQLNFSHLILYPGTPIYDYAYTKGIIPDAITFLKKNMSLDVINITNIPDKKFYDMSTLRMELGKYMKVYGNLEKVEFQEHDKFNRLLFKIETTCGHCQEKNIYKNFYINRNLYLGGTLKVHCRSCNQKYDLALDKFYEYYKQKVKLDLERFIKNKTPLFLFGCKEEKFLLKEFEFFGIEHETLNIERFFDNNLQRVNKNYLNWSIVENYNDLDFSKIDKSIQFFIPALYNKNAVISIKNYIMSKGIEANRIYSIDRLAVYDIEGIYLVD